MPMSVVYTNFDGQIVHENREGVERTYVSDPQGSTIALLDEDGTVTDTFDYWPYGEVSDRTGTTPTPFGYVGTLGYYEDPDGSLYVRARDYRPELARWQTVDPLWPEESAYGYVGGRVTSATDPSGYVPYIPRPSIHKSAGGAIKRIGKFVPGLGPATLIRDLAECVATGIGQIGGNPKSNVKMNICQSCCETAWGGVGGAIGGIVTGGPWGGGVGSVLGHLMGGASCQNMCACWFDPKNCVIEEIRRGCKPDTNFGVGRNHGSGGPGSKPVI